MTVQIEELELDDATLSGGAEIVSAGDGLPRRISTEEPHFFGTWGQTAFDDPTLWPPDGWPQWAFYDSGKVLLSNRRAEKVYFYDEDLSFQQSVDLKGIFGVVVDESAREIYAISDDPNQVAVWDLDDPGGGIVRTWALPFRPIRVEFGPHNGLVYITENANGSEIFVYDPADGSLVRTVTSPVALNDRNKPVATSHGIVVQSGTGATVLISDEASSSTILANYLTPVSEFPVAENLDHRSDRIVSGIARWDDDHLIHLSGVPGHMRLLGVADGALVETMAVMGVRDTDMHESERATSEIDRGAIGARDPYVLVPLDNRSGTLWVRINAGAQKATWTKTFAAGSFPQGVTLKGIGVPGALGREFWGDTDRTPGVETSEDTLRTKIFYRIDGGSQVEIEPGQMNLDVAISADSELTLEVEMDGGAGAGSNRPVWIGGDSGEGPYLVYDDPAATTFVEVPVASLSGSLGGQTPDGDLTISAQ
ncbi:MAG: YncE family protein [Longimicrobiales bacterium]